MRDFDEDIRFLFLLLLLHLFPPPPPPSFLSWPHVIWVTSLGRSSPHGDHHGFVISTTLQLARMKLCPRPNNLCFIRSTDILPAFCLLISSSFKSVSKQIVEGGGTPWGLPFNFTPIHLYPIYSGKYSVTRNIYVTLTRYVHRAWKPVC